MEQSQPSDLSQLSFEEAMRALESIVDQLDRGSVPLEKSIALYEQGAALQRHCETKLREAEMRVEKIVTNSAGGAASTEPLDGAPVSR